MAKTRTTHVRRIEKYTQDEIAADDRLIQMSVDIERVDTLFSAEQGLDSYQKATRKIFWADESVLDEHPTRTLDFWRMEKPDNPLLFIDIPITKQGVFRRYPRAPVGRAQGTKKRFVKGMAQRTFTVRRVYHGTSTPSDPNGAPPETPYTKDTSVGNKSQYVDVALITKMPTRTQRNGRFQQRSYTLNVEHLKEYSEESPLALDDPAVVQLDPFQNIVNINWGNWPAPFIKVHYPIFRRMDFGPLQPGNEELPPSGNPEATVKATLISYTTDYFWPYDPTGPFVVRASPPFDDDPNTTPLILDSSVSNWPALPGVSGLGAGTLATPGSASRDYGMMREGTLGIKFRETNGGPTTSPYGDLPEINWFAYFGVEAPGWGPPTATIELYKVLFLGTDAGPVVDTHDISFGGTSASVGPWNYSPIGFAAVPRQYGQIAYGSEGQVVGSNQNHRADGQVLYMINNPPLGYDP